MTDALDFLNVEDAERRAREKLAEGPYGYYAGGAEDEDTLRANVDAWRRHKIVYRVLRDVSERRLDTTALGAPVSMPILVAPTAFHALAHPDAERATARAAAAEGTLMTVSSLSTTRLEDVAAAAPGAPRWFQLYVYKDRKAAEAVVARAERAGYGAIVLTVDTPILGRRERDRRTGFLLDVRPANFDVPAGPASSGAAMLAKVFGDLDASLTWKDVDWLRSITSLPILVKGVVHPDDARLAVEHGCAGVIVSNHGGRQLDGAVATADALPDVARAVAGRAEVWVDGGVRRGVDVLRALALGARGVLVGRPVLWGLAAGGEPGARGVLALLRRELDAAMALAGARDVAEAARVELRFGHEPVNAPPDRV